MKASRQTKIRSIVVLVVAALLLELTTAVQYYSARKSITTQLTEMAQRDLRETNHTALLKKQVETAMTQALPHIERLANRHDADSTRLFIREMLDQQPQIVGIDFCYVVGDDGKHDGIYIYRNDDGGLTEQVIDFDYTCRSWYSQALCNEDFWSEPYNSNYKEILMSTYSKPVRDNSGKTIAVLGADIPMQELSALVSQIYKNQQHSLLPIILLHILGLAVLAFIIRQSIKSISHLQEVKAEKERFENELNIAGGIQQAMLPKTFPPYPECNYIDICASLVPAREVGGDFYDFLIRDNKLFLCIGDVSGKGVPAALVMAVARSVFRTLATRESAPQRIVTAMNDMMSQDNDYNMFITLFIGVLDLQTGVLRYTNAGHKAPFIDNEILPTDPNLPVGVMPNQTFTAQEITIPYGSIIFLYTDGLTEAENAAKDQFGTERMKKALNISSPKQLITDMNTAVHSFVDGTEQSDDLTMLAVSYKGIPSDTRLTRSLTLPCDLNQITRLSELVEDICHEANFSTSTTLQINLAVEEAVVNVMNYAYPPDINGIVSIEATLDDKMLKFTIIDNGQAFDPTTQKEVDTSLPAEERIIGGLGIHLMRRYMDSVKYERHDGRNILTMCKEIEEQK